MRSFVLPLLGLLLSAGCLLPKGGPEERDSGISMLDGGSFLDAGAEDAGEADAGQLMDSGRSNVDAGLNVELTDSGHDGGFWCPQRSELSDFCEASRLGAEWEEFLRLPSLKDCALDTDCAYLPPGPFYRDYYDCECSTGGAIWGKDGMAINVDFASRAEQLNGIFLLDECRRYADCVGSVCDGRRRIGAACSFGRCRLVDDQCSQDCGLPVGDFDGGPDCR